MTNKTYNRILTESAERAGNIACIGLDPIIEALPYEYRQLGIEGARKFYGELFARMADRRLCPSAIKLNAGFYLQHDDPMKGNFKGSATLASTFALIRECFLGMPIILDNKRGDIARSSANYAREALHSWNADALTVMPYMGRDAVEPFVKHAIPDKGVYVVTHTPNPGANDFQRLPVRTSDGKFLPLYEVVARNVVLWSGTTQCVGAVVGATPVGTLQALCQIFADSGTPVLIPGVGAQGGCPSDVVSRLRNCRYNLLLARVSSSSDLTHPWHNEGQPAPIESSAVCVDRIAHFISQLRLCDKDG
jgi:orotidine-5'-phosphate decarboxylase